MGISAWMLGSRCLLENCYSNNRLSLNCEWCIILFHSLGSEEFKGIVHPKMKTFHLLSSCFSDFSDN